ncbi:MAG: thioesterase family protein [Pirellulales bacterium]|nr:thioesterase family protein [Pirellulales bacterium]
MSHPVFFEREQNRWFPQRAAVGPWSSESLHAGPVAALCVTLGEELVPGDDWVTTRLTMDLLRPVTTQPLEVGSRIVKAGRRVTLLEITLSQENKFTASAFVQRTRQQDFTLPPLEGTGVELQPPPDRPENFAPLNFDGRQPRLAPFVDEASEIRTQVPGAMYKPTPSAAWIRVFAELLPGRPLSHTAAVAAAADCGNAFGAPIGLESPQYLFMNADLTLHLARAPEEPWVRMAPESVWLDHGIGQTRCALCDRRGMLGTSVVTLPLAQRPS